MLIKDYLDRKERKVRRFKENKPGVDYIENLIKRNPILTHRVAASMSLRRASVSADMLHKFYNNLATTIGDVPPSNIINYDETNLTDDPGSKKFIFKRGKKYP